MFGYCHVFGWGVVYYSVPVGPLLVGEYYEFTGELASPEFSRDSSDILGVQDGGHMVDQGSR